MYVWITLLTNKYQEERREEEERRRKEEEEVAGWVDSYGTGG